MDGHRGKRLGRIFVELGVINTDQEKAALAFAKRHAIPFGQACVRLGLVNEETVVNGLSLQLGAPACSLQGISVADSVKALVPARLAEKERIVPLSLIPAAPGARVGTLVVAMSCPKNMMELDELSFMTGCRISPVISSDSDIDAAILRLYGVDVGRHTRASYNVELEPGEPLLEEPEELQVVQNPLEFLPTVQISRR